MNDHYEWAIIICNHKTANKKYHKYFNVGTGPNST